jgi:hypothetical protein
MIPRVYEVVWDVLCVMHVDYPSLPVVAGSSSRPRTEMKPGRDLRQWLGHVIWSFRLRMLRWRTKHVPVPEPKPAPRVAGPWVHHSLVVILFLLRVRWWCLWVPLLLLEASLLAPALLHCTSCQGVDSWVKTLHHSIDPWHPWMLFPPWRCPFGETIDIAHKSLLPAVFWVCTGMF